MQAINEKKKNILSDIDFLGVRTPDDVRAILKLEQRKVIYWDDCLALVPITAETRKDFCTVRTVLLIVLIFV